MNYKKKQLLIRLRASVIGNVLVKIYYLFQYPIKLVISTKYIRGVRFNFERLGKKFIKIERGRHSYGDIHLQIYQKGAHLTIGSYCSISKISIIFGGQHHMDISTYIMKKHFLDLDDDNSPPKPIEIGNDVWIGYDAVILEGVKIGNGAIIGARCVVSKDVEPYTIVVGNPPIVLKKRFAKDEIDALERAKWWELNEMDLLPILDLFYSNDVDLFLKAIKNIKESYYNQH